jgi:acyl-CoA dehydrogenase
MALAVTEPSFGSDVSNLQTTAVLKDGYYIVNGAKKFITSGMKADYLITAVRTKDKGMQGISILLINRETEGVKCTRLKTQGWKTSNTALIVFDNVSYIPKIKPGKSTSKEFIRKREFWIFTSDGEFQS